MLIRGRTARASFALGAVEAPRLSVAVSPLIKINDVQAELTKDRGLNTSIDPKLFDRTNELGVKRRILRQAVGGDAQRQPKLTKKVTRPIMILIDHLHNLGNFGQHMKDIPPERERPVDFIFCVSACFAAISLLKRMTEDLT